MHPLSQLLVVTADDRTGCSAAIRSRVALSGQTFEGNTGTRAQNIRLRTVKHQAGGRLSRIFGGLTILRYVRWKRFQGECKDRL